MNTFSKRLPMLMKKFLLPSVGVIALLVLSIFVINEAKKSTVTVIVDGEDETIETHAETVGELLDELDINVSKHDDVSKDLEDDIKDGMKIEYTEAKQVHITIDDEETKYYTTKDTVGELFAEKDIQVSSNDDVSHNEDEEITDHLQITIDRAFQVSIKDRDEKEKKVWTTGDTVKNLLKENDIDVPQKDDLDYVEPSLEDEITEEATITITKVEKEDINIEEDIDYEVEEKKDDSLTKGKKKTEQKGKKGKLVKTYEITKENGEEVDRKLVNEEVQEEPQNKVIAIGTKEEQPKLTTVADSNSKKEPSGKELYVNASAYTANCKGCSGKTRTGINLKANPNEKVIAVDPDTIPLGSKVWVEGYGHAVAADTGGSIKGDRIDVHVPSKSEAHQFGMKRVKVVIKE